MSRGVASEKLREHIKAGLIKRKDGRFYLDLEGMKLISIRDRISLEVVRERFAVYLRENGRYLRQQRRHNLGQARVAGMVVEIGHKLGFRIFSGWMWVVDLQDQRRGATQLRPDFWLEVPIGGGRGVLLPGGVRANGHD